MPVKPFALIALALCAHAAGCGETPAPSPDAAATAADVVADAAADAVADTGAPADSAVTETAAETVQDAGPDGIDPDSAYGKRCSKIADLLCKGAATCCGAVSGTCIGKLTAECLKPGKYKDIAAAAAAGDLALDPAWDATCTAAIATWGKACDQNALDGAATHCLNAWFDPAAVNGPCNGGVEVACAAGKGQCVETLPGDVKCLAAFSHGDSCSKFAPCQLGHQCADTDLPRAKQCRAWGSKCGTAGDTVLACPAGLVCANGACVADPGVATGGACVKDAECRAHHLCTGGKCVPTICSKLP